MSLAARRPAPTTREELVCWTRMQSEAGQGIESIVARKELERRAGKGIFFWGVGNAPAVATPTYARLQVPVRVVFSLMKGRPRSIDARPRSLAVWRRYLDMFGVERDLPEHVLITSRGETAAGEKTRHYALICKSDSPLHIERGIGFAPSAYRNVGSNAGAVGPSQVTALLQRVAPMAGMEYEVNMTAELVGSYWVRLTDPASLDIDQIARIDKVNPSDTVSDWLWLVRDLRNRSSAIKHQVRQSSLL